MKKLAATYLKLSPERKSLFILIAVSLMISLCLLPFSLLSLPGLSIGFLAGSAVQVLAYLSLCYSMKLISRPGALEKKKALWAIPLFFLRWLLYAGILVLAAFCTYRWNSTWMNFWATFAGLMPIYVILVVTFLTHRSQGVGGLFDDTKPAETTTEQPALEEKEAPEALTEPEPSPVEEPSEEENAGVEGDLVPEGEGEAVSLETTEPISNEGDTITEPKESEATPEAKGEEEC